MGLITRGLPIAIRSFRRQIQTAVPAGAAPVAGAGAGAGAADALALRLLRESESGIKATLDSEANSAFGDVGRCFWESLIFNLGAFSSRKAVLVLEWKLEKLLKEDIRTYDPYLKLIQYSGNLNSFSFAMRVFTSIESHGILPNTSIFNALISVCMSSDSLATALSLFEIMQWSENAKPDLITYNSFISMYSNLGDDRCMKGWYLAAKQSGFLHNIHTYELLITGLVRLGKFKDADELFVEMMSSEISPNTQILDSMLDRFCIEKDTEKLMELIEYMMKGGLKSSKFSVKNLIDLCFEQGKIEDLVAVLGLLKTSDVFSIEPGIHGSVIRAYALLDKIEDMEYWIGQMLNDDGKIFICKEDLEAVICSYFRQKAFRRLDLFLDQIKGRYKLAKSTYDILVAGYRKFELYDRLDSIIREMNEVPIYLDDLEHILDENLLLSFNTEIMDGSIEEIAEQLLLMHDDCLHEDYDLIEKLRKTVHGDKL